MDIRSRPVSVQDVTIECADNTSPQREHLKREGTIVLENLSKEDEGTKQQYDTNNLTRLKEMFVPEKLQRESRIDERVFGGAALTPTAEEQADYPGVTSHIEASVQEVQGDMPRPGSQMVAASGRFSSLRSEPAIYYKARERRARRVRFYRNGDRFFKGMIYAVSIERFRSFENLLTALTSSNICDNRTMPNGVRSIFSLDGARQIGSLEELEDGESYVCASNDIFRTLDYSKNEECDWNPYSPKGNLLGKPGFTYRPVSKADKPDYHKVDYHRSLSSQSQAESPVCGGQGEGTSVKPSKSAIYKQSVAERSRRHQMSVVTPRLITVLKQGKRPRRAVRLLLNRKTAQNFDQVMSDISSAVKMECCKVRKLFGISGRPVTCLADLFGEDTIFIACGKEKMALEQLDLDHREVRQVNAYRPFSATMRDRVTLRRSRDERLRLATSSDHRTTDYRATGEAARDTSQPPHSSNKSEMSNMLGDRVHSSNCSSRRSQSSETVSQQSHNKQENGFSNNSETDAIPKPITLINKYDVGQKIGTGNFAQVLECRDKRTKRKYALKIINKESCKGKEKMIDNEVRILRYVNHPNIIRLIEDFTNQQRIFYIMELVKGGDLFDAIASSTKYTETDASGILHNLVSALDYLHAIKIVHRDVKPENLLIQQHEDGTKSLKLGDFGLATEVKGQLYTVCGTPTYVAPEVIAESGYGVKIDVWSAGVIAYILLCGFPPFSSPTDDQEELFDLIMTACYDFPNPYWEDISESAKNLIKRMLELNPERRLSAAQILQNKWVSGESTSAADLQKTVSSGLGTYFRRSPRNPTRNAGIQIIATTALDKVSRYFQGRGSPMDKVRGTPT